MRRYVLLRIIQAAVAMLAVASIAFMLVRLSGDLVDVMLPDEATEEQRAAVTASMGLDKPYYVQYGLFLKNLVRGDLGRSNRYGKPVTEVILKRMPATIIWGY